MSTKKKIFMFILGIEAIAIAGLVIFLFYINNDTVRVKRQLELAQHYLLEEEYEQAIAVFNTIIEIDSKNEDAYIGLAQAYAESGNLEDAVKTLEKGYKETNAKGIYELKVIQTEELAQIEAQKQEETTLTTDMESQPENMETETVNTASSENTSQTEEITPVQTGFVAQDGELYYYDEQGNMVTGWFDVNNKRYCARQDGKLYKGDKYEVDGVNYLFGQDGLCLGEMKDDAWKQAYIDKIREYDASIYTFDLIDLNGDDIPELVVDEYGYCVSLFTYGNGTIQTLMDEWGYGAFGIGGYEYISGKNVILLVDTDLAGAICYQYYIKMDENYELVDYYPQALSYWMFEDKNKNYMIDDGEYIEDIYGNPLCYYYFGDREITEEEFNSYQIHGNYEYINGTKKVNEIIEQITNW